MTHGSYMALSSLLTGARFNLWLHKYDLTGRHLATALPDDKLLRAAATAGPRAAALARAVLTRQHPPNMTLLNDYYITAMRRDTTTQLHPSRHPRE